MTEKYIDEDKVLLIANMMIQDLIERLNDEVFPEEVCAMEIHLAGLVATRKMESILMESVNKEPLSIDEHFEILKPSYEVFIQQCEQSQEEEEEI